MNIDKMQVLSWVEYILNLLAIITIATAVVYLLYYRVPIEEVYLYIIAFLAIHLLRMFILYEIDFHAYNSTLGVTLEYAFGVNADPEECLQKIVKWGQENGIDVRIK